jgi:enoyl-CoA hydratase/carnithine racemase
MPTETSDVLARRDGAVLTLTFNRPQKRNAFTVEMYARLAALLAEAGADEGVRAVVVEGAGEAFTSGNDVRDFVERPPLGEDAPVFRFLLRLVAFEKPLLAAVQGAAVGIGTTMLLHCDDVTAAPSATFSLRFVNLGLCPEGGSSLLLPLRAGPLLASELLLSGASFDVATAERARLVNRVVAEGELGRSVAARAAAIAEKPAAAVRATKRLLRTPWRDEVLAALRREAAEFKERILSPEAAQAFSAFLAKKG